jgi:N6-L-threonylcarbamoyladenine synthase
MRIFAVETSCDDTAAAWLEIKPSGFKILGEAVESQEKLHARYGGVMPRLAAEEHERRLPGLVSGVVKQFSKKKIGEVFRHEVDVLAVTTRPGLEPALLVGVAFAQALAFRSNIPAIGIDHLSGHLASAFVEEAEEGMYRLREVRYPAACLVVSGGHTNLYLLRDGFRSAELVGQTRDDAAGEAFDKVSRMLSLGYPGGPAIEKTTGTVLG